MPAQKALRRRVAPSVPLRLKLADETGEFTLAFRLSFDFNALAEIEERTGVSMLDGAVWKHLSARTLRVMLWAAVCTNHPEYHSDEGLDVIGSYMDASNAGEIAAALERAFVASVPESARGGPADGPAERPTAAPAETPGATSGPSPDSTSGLAFVNSDASLQANSTP